MKNYATGGVGVNEEPTIPKKSGEELDDVKINKIILSDSFYKKTSPNENPGMFVLLLVKKHIVF